MKKRTKNRGIRAVSVLISFVLAAVFLSGNVFVGIVAGPSVSMVVKNNDQNQFVGESFFVANRPTTE